MSKLRKSVDKNWYSHCDKMLQTIKESFNIIYYGNTDKVCHVDTVTSLQDAWRVISQDRYDMQSFHATFGHSRKKQNYEVWQDNQLVVQVTYDR